MNYFELTCNATSEQHAEILMVRLAELGFESFTDIENGIKGYIQETLYTEDVKAQVLRFHDSFYFEQSIQFLPDQNWNHEWEKNFSPINVNDKCYIRASFHKPVPEIQFDVLINPKMSFGTGHHETTYLVIAQMLELNLKDTKVCDMGCGTGILSVLAAKMGASFVLAVDTDEWAVKNARENIDTNKVKGVVVKKGDVQMLAGRTFHVILANINRNILLMDMEFYIQSLEKEGVLVLSGFFETDVSEIQMKAVSLGLKIVNVQRKNKWSMIYFINQYNG
jgi:ribosomal protein L11 methyltransferase